MLIGTELRSHVRPGASALYVRPKRTAPASGVLYVPEAQGSLPQGLLYVRCGVPALTLTQSGLEVAVVWRHGRKVPTPAASFMAHAMRALHATLRALGSGLVVLYAADESEESAAEAVAARALQLGVDYVVVDACEAAGAAAAGLVAAALRRSIIEPRSQTDAQSDAEPLTMPTVEAMVDDTLFPHDVTDRHSNLRPTDLQTR